MLSHSHSNEQDETNETGIFQQNLSKKEAVDKKIGKKTQSLSVKQGLCKKIQKFLQRSREHDTYDFHHTSLEVEEDMFICGIKRGPGVTSMPSGKSPTKTDKKHQPVELELNSDDTTGIQCPEYINSPATESRANSKCVDKSARMEEMQRPTNKDVGEGGSKERRSSTIVEHILKELQGINKIQEEISDLRQYLMSVSGSVDEVSCCVDAVLMEIEELYSTGAIGRPSPQRVVTRRRSLGRQKGGTAIKRHKSPLLKGPVKSERNGTSAYCDVSRKAKTHDPEVSDNSEESSCRVCPSKYPHHDVMYGQDFPSTSSLSSCHSSKNRGQNGALQSREGDPQTSGWEHSGMTISESREGGWSGDTGWSEEDCCSCHSSADEVGDGRKPDTWHRYNAGETSSTPVHSSESSSEHFSLLFGHQYNSLSSLSSAADWRQPRKQVVSDIECEYAPNCPYSRSSGYHTMDAYADEPCSGPSRSLSCSTMGLTDYDDGCQDLHSSCEHCLCIEHADVDSADSMERVWPHRVCPSMTEEQCGSHCSENSNTDASQPPNVGIDMEKVSKAMLTFRSALRGALKRLEEPDSQCSDEENISDVASSPDSHSNGHLEVHSTVDSYGSEHIMPTSSETLDQSLTLQKTGDACFQGEYNLNNLKVQVMQPSESLQFFDPQGSMSGTASPFCTPTEYYSMDNSFSAEKCLSDQELSHADGSLDLSPEKVDYNSGIVHTGPEEILHTKMASTACETTVPRSLDTILETETRLDQIETQVEPDSDIPEQLDPHHQKCLANIQRVLKEQRQRHRLSRISSGSKHTFSEEEFNTEESREDDQVT